MKKFIKSHSSIMEACFFLARYFVTLLMYLIPVRKKTLLFVSLGGRNFDDSPKAIYEQILVDPFFQDWKMIWAFNEPEKFSIPRGEIIRFGSKKYIKALLTCQVWIGNGGLDAGLDLNPPRRIVVNTWHGSVLKKSEGEENANGVLKKYRKAKKIDKRTIRCAQNEFDIHTYIRLFRASRECFLKCGLPRNDILIQYTEEDRRRLRKKFGIEDNKKIILYMPTYREYLINEHNENYIAPPISLDKWARELSNEHVLFMRAHYAVTSGLNIHNDGFIFDVSSYQPLSELYLVADILITDYSSCFYDFAILGKPILCFAYDRSEYEEKRGLYLKLEDVMPCGVFSEEDSLIQKIRNMDYDTESAKIEEFREQMVPYYGNGSRAIIEEIKRKLMR